MQHDSRKYLWDALRAADFVATFTEGKTFLDYDSDVMLRSAVERQFEIVGESLGQLSKVEPSLAERIPNLGRIVAFRNILIHGYAAVDDALVWQVASDHLPALQDVLRMLLRDGD